MGKASVPKRGRAVKTRPLRSDAQSKGMPSIALGKGSKKGKLKPVTVKKGKVKLKPTKAKQKPKPEAKPALDAEDSDTASVASARVRRGAAPDAEASTSRSPNDADVKGSKRLKALSERSESPATTRLSRSSSANSFVGKTSEAKKTGKATVEKGKGKSLVSTPSNKTILNFFTRNTSPSSKGPTESNSKKTTSTSRKESEVIGTSNKRGIASTDSSPDSLNSGSNQVTSERSEINDDDLSALDDAESCLVSHSEDLDAPSTLNGVGGRISKATPKLTRKNINELFPSDDLRSDRLRSGSPASQKSTRSLTLQRNSPKSASASSLRSTTMSDSAVRFLRNGQQNKLKRSSLFETASKKKKRVYAGALKDEDKVEDSRSDFSDEQSSIFSESDSSSFIDSSSRLKNTDLDKMDVEDVPGSLSNDEDDMTMERISSPTQKNLNTVTNVIATEEVKENCLDPSDSPSEEKSAQQPPKNIEILNNIQSDWDSDGEGHSQGNDISEPTSPKEGHSASNELLTSRALPQLNVKHSGNDDLPENLGTNDVSPPDLKKLEEKQGSDAAAATPLDSSKSESQPNVGSDNPSTVQTEFSNIKSQLPEPIVLKTSENKNTFTESVEFVSKRHTKNSKIDFELLRRRTKRSMSFNTDPPEMSQNQKILAVEPNKVHGKPALVWTVTAVRDPIIPKSTKSSEKKITKSDSQENKNVSPVKPMMESTQNDLTTAVPKVSPDTILSSSQFSVSSSSVKENIMIQTSLKQSAGKSPVRESVVSGGSPKSAPIASTKEAKTASSVNGGLDSDKSSNAVSKPSSEDTPCSLNDSSMKQPAELPVSTEEDPALTPKLLPLAAAVVASNDALCAEVLVATALKTPAEESGIEKDAATPSLVIENAQTHETCKERSSTPDSSLPAVQKNVEVTPEKVAFDDESFSLRLSPTPTKEDNSKVRCASVSSSKSDSCLISNDTSPIKHEENIAGKESESNDLATRLLDNSCKSDEILDQNNSSADVSAKAEGHSLQLIIRKGSCRPRSLSADCTLSSLSVVDDVWVVKNGESSPLLETPAEEDKSSACDEKKEETEIKDQLAGNGHDLHLEIISNSVTLSESSEPGNNSVKADAMKNDSSSDVIAVNVKQPGLLSPRLEAEVERHNLELNDIEKKRREITEEEQSPEKKAIKEWILNSLGLQSVTAAAAAAASGAGRPTKRRSQDGLLPSSGRLKAVIKVPKDSKRDKKSDRKPLRMVFKNGKPHPGGSEDGAALGRYSESDTMLPLEGNNGLEVSNLLFNGPEHPSSGSLASLGDASSSLPTAEGDGKGKTGANLVIPEKSSSFSIHPGRLCSDVCSYCFGKFGSLDTPCHVAQLKSRERQMKIMSVETHLAMDSCLCDACIRYVDRKANCPSSKPQTTHRKDSKSKFEGSMATCSVNSCVQPARHSLRKKWYIKIRKSVVKKCPIDLELAHQHLPLPLCPEHFSYMEYFMVCGLCKRRLSRNHMYNLNNTHEINICLEHDGIPARLTDKLFVCKLCRYYATLRLKHPGSHFNLSSNQREFFNSYRKRILRSHDIEISDSEGGEDDPEAAAEEQVSEDASHMSGAASTTSNASATTAEENVPKGKRKRSGSIAAAPAEVDSGEQPKKKSRHSDQHGRTRDKAEMGRTASRGRSREREPVPPVTISVSEISQAAQARSHKGGRAAKKQQEVEHAAAAEMARKGHPPFYPGEDELALHAQFQFQYDEPSASRAWEKCTSTLQFDKDTKRLWQELQRPYGSQSSFLRHLVLMERYWREGELVLAPDASAKATSYTRSVQNRLKAYGATITVKSTPEPARPASTSTSGQATPKAATAATTVTATAAPASVARPVVPPAASSVALAKPDVSLSLALTGDTVLTAAAAAAAVTAVHTAPLASPSGEASPTMQSKQQPKVQQARAQPPKVPQMKPLQCQIPQRKTQQVKGVQSKSKTVGVKPQVQPNPVTAPPKPQQPLQIAPVASPLPIKSPQAITVTVKPLEPPPVKQPLPRNQVAISLASHPHKPISTSVSVSSGVTITPEPSGKTTPDKPQANAGKLQSILSKPPVTSIASSSISVGARVNSGSWETSSSSPPSRQQFLPLSSSPVVNLTRSISLTAVPSTPTSMPDLHPINPQTPRLNRSPSTTLPSVSVTASRVPVSSSGSGAFVSIIPTSPSKAAYSAPSSLSLNKPASITPIYTSQSLPAPVNVTSSTTSASSVSSPAVASTESRATNTGKVQVAAGGKFFYLTIPQFKKLQTLRQQRQLEQQKKQAAKQDKDKRVGSSTLTSTAQKSDLEVVEVGDTDSEAQLSPLPTISAVCSGDQAKAMWNDESRSSESDPSVSISVAPPVVEITPIMAKPDIIVENMPKIPKTLTVTQIRKESPQLSKTVSASGISLTITRQKCQTPVAPQMSSPALDIFPS